MDTVTPSAERRWKRVHLSGGWRRFSERLSDSPALLLIDEPDFGLDAAGRAIIGRLLSQRRTTVLFVTHDMDHINMAEVVWHFENGRLVEQGAPEKLLMGDGPLARSLMTAAPSAKAGP